MTSTEPHYRSIADSQPFDYYAEVAADVMVAGLEEAADRARRYWEGYHRESAGQLVLDPSLQVTYGTPDIGALL